MDKFKAILLLGVPAVLLLAAVILVLMNLSGTSDLYLYGTHVQGPLGVIMLLSAAGGLALWSVCRLMLPTGLRALRRSRANRPGPTPTPADLPPKSENP